MARNGSIYDCSLCGKPANDFWNYHPVSKGPICDDCEYPSELFSVFVEDARQVAERHREDNRIKSTIDARKWYLITLTSEIGHPDAITVIKGTLTKFYKSKMFKGEKYHSWEINEQGMIHVHIILITNTYCPHKDKLKHKWFVDIRLLIHKRFDYLIKNLFDPIHIELKEKNNLSDNLPANASKAPSTQKDNQEADSSENLVKEPDGGRQ